MLKIRKYCGINPIRLQINGQETLANENGLDFKKFLKYIYKHFEVDYPKYFKMDGLSKLGFLSIEVLLQNESIIHKYPTEKTGLILTNASSSLEVDEKHFKTIMDRKNYFPSPSNFVYTLPNIMAGEAAIRHGMKGENTVLISESFDPELITNTCREAFSSGLINCCICGWVEQYANNYESLLFIVEEEDDNIESKHSGEDVIFESSNLLKIYKQHTQWKN